jgi:hypothetical protein
MADYMVAEQVLGQVITIALAVMVLSELYGGTLGRFRQLTPAIYNMYLLFCQLKR